MCAAYTENYDMVESTQSSKPDILIWDCLIGWWGACLLYV
jgi:hypothetical protein